VIALFVDGVVVAQQTAIVALGVTRDGRKEPLRLSLGSTETAVVCFELLQDLLARGLTVDGRVLCVIDGGKGLRKALGDVLGDAAVIQRCQLHKGRNLAALVPQARQVYVRAALRRAYGATSAAAARRQLSALVRWLDTNGEAAAAAGLREGLEETLTVVKLGLPPTRRRFFATTNCIENLIGTRRHISPHVKRWRAGDMRRRWLGLGCCAWSRRQSSSQWPNRLRIVSLIHDFNSRVSTRARQSAEAQSAPPSEAMATILPLWYVGPPESPKQIVTGSRLKLAQFWSSSVPSVERPMRRNPSKLSSGPVTP
jgi:hypothetical protein